MNGFINKRMCFKLLGLLLIATAQTALANEHAKPQSHSVNYQKPGAPVTLMSKTQYRLEVGQELDVELALKLAPGETHVSLQPDAGLVINGPSSWQTSDLRSEKTLTVTSLAAQKAYIHIYVEHISPQGHASTRALAIAIDSRGAQQALKAAKPAKPFVEMQAAESIY